MCISSQQRNLFNQSFGMGDLPKTVPRPKRSSKSHNKRRDHQFIVVQHHYHDHANECATTEEQLILDSAQQNPLVASFPMKLFMMLEQVEADGNAHIVSWQPHGRCFAVHEPELFKELLPRYFSLSKVSSFQRQLNLYDFTRLTRGKDKGGYYNEFFLRGRAHLLSKIQRIKVKGTGVRARSNPEQEPNFWTMPYVGATTSTSSPETQVSSSMASVVSEDEHELVEEQQQQPRSSLVSSSSQQVQNQANESDVRLCGWGMPFYYLESLPEETATETRSTTGGFYKAPQVASTVDFLSSIDMDDFMNSVVDVDTDLSFSNLLEKIVD